jgi:hypothetical protein
MKKYANIFTITVLLFFVQFACQKAEIESSMVQKNDTFINQIDFLSKGSLLKNKLVEARKRGNLKKESPILDFQNGVELRKNARIAAADKGCGKFKMITTSFPKFNYDEVNVITYKANNLIDYIDYSYSDFPSSNGRMFFTYNATMTKLTISYKYADGEIPEFVDKIDLNSKGYATLWEHDLSNFYYDTPYLELINYNSAGYAITIIHGKLNAPVSDPASTLLYNNIKYSAANNIESTTDLVSGNVSTFTTDLTRPAKIALSTHPIYWDYTRLYGATDPNYYTKVEVKDKAGKLIRTVNIVREFSADGYPTKVTRKVDGVDDEIFKDMTYDCTNYNVSQPRSYK